MFWLRGLDILIGTDFSLENYGFDQKLLAQQMIIIPFRCFVLYNKFVASFAQHGDDDYNVQAEGAKGFNQMLAALGEGEQALPGLQVIR